MEDNQPSSNDDNNITLRLMDLSDIDDFMVWATDDKVSQFCTWKTCTSKEEAMTYMINSVIPHPWMRAICLKHRAIGYIMLTAFEGNDACRCEVGYVLASKYWGKGIATRALKMVASTIFHERTHLERLDAWVDKDNLGSHRVLVKAGFQKEGVLRKYMLIKGKPRDMISETWTSKDSRSIDWKLMCLRKSCMPIKQSCTREICRELILIFRRRSKKFWVLIMFSLGG